MLERRLPGIEGSTRVLARPLPGRSAASVVVVGQSLDDRNVALSGLVTSFAVGGVLAIVLMSALGYAVATAGLAPVEAMRRRAAEVSLSNDDERLPLPAAHDEIRRLGETLNDMLDRLRRSFERERQFVADASHELRTPVAVVKTELEGALRTGDYGPHVREALVAAIDECDHLAQMADDLLIIARAGEGELPIRREAVALGPLFEGVREHFVDRASQHGRAVRIEVPDGRRGPRRRAATRPGARQPGRQRAALWGGRHPAARPPRARGRRARGLRPRPRVRARHRRAGVRALRARRRRPYPRRDGPGDGDRPRRGRGARGLGDDRRGRRRHRGDLAAPGRRSPAVARSDARPAADLSRCVSDWSHLRSLRCRPCRPHCSPWSPRSPSSPVALRRPPCRRGAKA